MIPTMKRILIMVAAVAVVGLAVFLMGRYGWKLAGFSACESAGIEKVEIGDKEVQIKGFYPGSFPTGFIGYYAEEDAGTLYVGFKFSVVFGAFETGDFDISIPVEEEIKKVVIKTGKNEYMIWPDSDFAPDVSKALEIGACEWGIYINLEREDVYSIGWNYEEHSGGVSNADGTAFKNGNMLCLDVDITQIADDLGRPVSFRVKFHDSTGKVITQGDFLYDIDKPIMIITLDSEGELVIEERTL